MEIEFVASFSPIVRESSSSHAFYKEGLGIDFEGGEGEYVFTERLGGTKHLGLWPLSEAAKACFGSDQWPAEVAEPQASLEFEVKDVTEAAAELESKGYELIHGAKTEPWGQVTARLLSPEGLLVAVCHTPWFHSEQAE